MHHWLSQGGDPLSTWSGDLLHAMDWSSCVNAHNALHHFSCLYAAKGENWMQKLARYPFLHASCSKGLKALVCKPWSWLACSWYQGADVLPGGSGVLPVLRPRCAPCSKAQVHLPDMPCNLQERLARQAQTLPMLGWHKLNSSS